MCREGHFEKSFDFEIKEIDNQNSYVFLLVSYWDPTLDKSNWTQEKRKLVDVVHL